MRAQLESFFCHPPADRGAITNERALQLELGVFLRGRGIPVDFELSLKAPRLPGSTLKAKHNLDLLVLDRGQRVGIELKVPLHGQHPETMYAFLADIEFLEAIRRAGFIEHAFAVMMTPDRAFWTDSGRGSPIHNLFRQSDTWISGRVEKPTGARDSCILIEGRYRIAGGWGECKDLLRDARYLIVDV